MGFGAIHSVHRSPERRTAPLPPFACEPSADASVTSASDLCGLCVSTFSLNFALLTVSYKKICLGPRRALLQLSSAMFSIRCALFARSFAIDYGSTALFSCRCALFCKHRGCTPSAAALSEPLLELTPLTSITPITTPRSLPAVAGHSLTTSAGAAVGRGR
jgi:hypothetical protein